MKQGIAASLGPCPPIRGSHLVLAQRSLRRLDEARVDREGEVAESDEDDKGITNELRTELVRLRDAKGLYGDGFLPAEASVGHEDKDGEDVVGRPASILEKIKLKLVDVTDRHGLHACILGPEEVKLEDALEVDQIGWWAYEVGLASTEAELEKVNGHEAQQQHPRDRQVELPTAYRVLQRDVPGTLEANHNMEQRTEGHVFLHDVRRKAKASAVKAHVEVAIAIEVIRAQEDMQVPHRVDYHEDKEEDRTPGQSTPVPGDLHVVGREDRTEELKDHAEDH